MPPSNFSTRDLRALDRLRGQETKVATRLVATEVKLSEEQAKLEALVRAGAAETRVYAARERIDTIVDGRKALRDELSDIRGRVGEIHERLPDPSIEVMIPNFRADTPVLMLPVRIETRYFDAGRELRIRIFPDQIHIDNHETELTEDEVAAGAFYWQQRWNTANPDAEAEVGAAAFAALARQFRPRRAAWIAYAMTPTNVGPPPRLDPPNFPNPARRAAAWSRAAFATLLPTRWVAVGYSGDARGTLTPAFTKSGSIVADRISIGLDPGAQSTPAVDADGIATELPLDDGIKWLADFAAAEAAGMALRVVTADLEAPLRRAGHTLAALPLERLIVYGTNAGMTADAAAARLEALLTAHLYADGLGLIASGTPTNNSENAASGHDSSDAAAIAAMDPIRGVSGPTPALDALVQALGVNGKAAHLDRMTGTTGTEQVTAGHMINALWSATLGQTLDQMFDPVISDEDIDRLRQHAVAHLRPGGALPAIRVGMQPYAILPVAAPTLFKPQDSVEEKLAQVIGGVRGVWTRAADKAPNLRRAGRTLSENMEELLQQTPLAVSNSFRRVYAAGFAKNATINANVTATQERVRTRVFDAIGLTRKPKIATMTAEPRQHRLGAPFVQARIGAVGAPLAPNYLAEMAAEATRTDGRAALVARGDASSLLETLASHATVYELDRAAASIVHKDRAEREGITMPERSALRIDEMIAVMPPPIDDARARATRQAFVQSPADLSRLVLPDRTGAKTVVNYAIGQLFDPRARDKDVIVRLSGAIDSLNYLATRSAAELDRATRGTLDCYSYRLDAWISSLANRRLASCRAKPTSKGLHIGGYGWVEKLKSDRRPDSEGYVHAPSLQQAQTAAVLRAGHLAHRDTAGAALAIDLSSRRVRLALTLLRGVAQGQPLTALLGYRLERAIRQKDIKLAKFILPMRRLFPLNPPAGDTVLGSQEAIAARDVVDAVKLLDKRRSGGNVFQGLNPAPSAAEKANIDAVIAEIDDMFDAVADVLVAEGVHQMVGGNLERASAALAGIDRQTRPVEPEVVRTPRSGRDFAQRVGTILVDDTTGADWADFPHDTRSIAEPALNAWVARLLGAPKDWRFAANLLLPGGGNRPLAAVNLVDLDWSPLSIALLAEPGGNARPSALQQRLAALFAKQVSDAERDENAELHLMPAAGTGGKNGLAAFEALLARIRAVMTRHRAATALDFAPPGTPAPSGVDAAALSARVDKVKVAQTAALAALDAAIADPTPSAVTLATALDRANAAGAREAVAASDVVESLLGQARQVSKLLAEGLARVGQMAAATGDDDMRADVHVGQLKAMLGDGFPVLPPFVLPATLRSELMASLGNADSLIGKDGAPLHGWMSQMASVRPRLADLASCLIASEMTGGGRPALSVAQFPHHPTARWIGLPLDANSPAAVDLSLVVHAPALDPTNPPATVAGMMSDDWTESIPNAKEMTAVSFHYDAPGARPPQAMLLAVHPDPAAAGWLPSQLLATVNEALDLAKIRCVRPQDLDFMGAILPLVYLPASYTRDVPGVDFGKIRMKVEAAISPELVSVLGKA